MTDCDLWKKSSLSLGRSFELSAAAYARLTRVRTLNKGNLAQPNAACNISSTYTLKKSFHRQSLLNKADAYLLQILYYWTGVLDYSSDSHEMTRFSVMILPYLTFTNLHTSSSSVSA